ncbi:hypothetical protein SCLCIDRAFT_16200 [Scleroderma citrinum Foug A]|uniref:CMP/dCMP-type deaminase domain-containing protein n=1 Tax=Scleroderma citrinum Foug A TaxID=1036808 RepID=A0A0C3DY78_9AGAM|nr:hypothetical protein SCLCIDRAFT_16200 [Scleroderma citrinum Foug A]
MTRHALKEADNCEPVQTVFCVSCALVICLPAHEFIILSTRYSRELSKCPCLRARSLSESQITALFPSHTQNPTIEGLLSHRFRTSGLPPCADTLICSNVKRCIVGVGEPDDFVECEGVTKLRDTGIEII